MNYIGIDIHKRYSVACVQDESGKIIKRVRIEGNKAEGFRRCLNGEPARAVIEACWNWGKVYDSLESIEGIEEVVLAHPLKTRLIADAQIKTDKIDATALATLLRGNLVARADGPINEIDPSTIRIGEPVRVIFQQVDDVFLPRWIR